MVAEYDSLSGGVDDRMSDPRATILLNTAVGRHMLEGR